MDNDTWTGVFTITADEYSDLLAPDHSGLLQANAFFQFMRGDGVDIVSDRFDFGVSQRDKGVMSICTDCAADLSFPVRVPCFGQTDGHGRALCQTDGRTRKSFETDGHGRVFRPYAHGTTSLLTDRNRRF